MRWSIRWRLTLLNTLAVGLLLIGFAALIYGMLARAVVGTVDSKLSECYQQLEREPRTVADSTRLRYHVDEFWEHEQVACAVYWPDGRLELRTELLTSDAVPPMPAFVAGESQFAFANLPVLGRQRVLAARLPYATDGRSRSLWP